MKKIKQPFIFVSSVTAKPIIKVWDGKKYHDGMKILNDWLGEIKGK